MSTKHFIKVNVPYDNIEANQVGIVQQEESDFYKVLFTNLKSIKIQKNDCQTIDPEKTGDNYDYKICNVCTRYLPTEEFPKNQNGKNNRSIRRPTCNRCRVAINGKNIPSVERKKWKKIKPSFEIWTCPICHKTTIPDVTSKVVLDHDHKTGIPRAWICDSCNTGLGRFKDDIQILENAINYLEDKKI
ncbi:MAG: endonuclease VII domain-containing protein [Lactobacillus sp.]|nr:endonuclease VII domain-containing protein [Lactobacillus sp.]